LNFSTRILRTVGARQTAGGPAILLSAVSFILAISILAAFVFEFVMCREFLDFLFPKGRSVNVVGRIAPESGRTERILIFSGHHDSAYEFTWASRLKIGYYLAVAVIFWGVIAISVKTGLHALGLALGGERLLNLGAIGRLNLLVPIAPSLILAFFFLGSGKNGGTVPGAADNLSGSMVAVSLGRLLKENHDFIPDDTEIRIISFGCEEAGMRGAKRYVKRHLGELKEKNAEVCNFEVVADPVVTILTSDCNGFVRNSLEVVEGLAAAARAAGVPHRVRPFPFGGAGTDACAFSEAGIKASCLLPVVYPRHLIRFYHQPADNWDVLTPEPLVNALKVSLEWVRSHAPAP
jgi:hypothetical protein